MSIVFSAIFIALLPVILSSNYIRQDDLMWEIWPGMRMSDFGYLYYNTVFQLVRPLCMLSFYLTDLISININNAVYVRLMSVLILCSLGVMLYWWQLCFNNNRLLAAIFAIAAFTLPPYQVFAATGNYSLIITALLLTFISAFSWYHYFRSNSRTVSKWYLHLGSLLFFLSLLEYPLSSMYLWALLAICYLNNLHTNEPYKTNNNRFILNTSLMIISLMIAYYIASRIFHLIFHVDLSTGRAAVIDTSHLFARLLQVAQVLSWHADLWFWKNTHSLLLSPIFLIAALFIIALLQTHKNEMKRFSKIMMTLTITVIFFFLAYSPILATSDVQITYRYALVTMPIILYVLLWSINTIVNSYSNNHIYPILTKIRTLFLFIACCIGICYSNLMIADGIVGPHSQDFTYIQQQLSEKVVPLLNENKKVVIHAIDCDQGNRYFGYNAPGMEYGMRICQYQQQIIGVIIHSLNKFGFASNYQRHNQVIYNDKEIVVKDTPWGTLVVNSSNSNTTATKYANKNTSIITIDTHDMPPYQPYSFYKELLGIRRT
jgi:hypothetical protein